jgi:tetratricopeptide (TPR) repeat protein
MAESFRRQRERAIGQRAAELYRGDFLDGIRVDGAPAFEEWVVVQRQWLHEKALRVFSDLFGLYYQEGDYAAALSYLDRLLALEPWQEEAHRQRMELLARLGRYSAALRQYDICRRVLHDELTVAPSAPTIALYDKIRHLHNQPPAQNLGLPLQPTPFLGREQELEQLNTFLLHPDERLITILGLGESERRGWLWKRHTAAAVPFWMVSPFWLWPLIPRPSTSRAPWPTLWALRLILPALPKTAFCSISRHKRSSSSSTISSTFSAVPPVNKLLPSSFWWQFWRRPRP